MDRGLTPAKDPVFKSIGLTCIKDLGEWKYYRRSILERADASGSARSVVRRCVGRHCGI